MKNLSFIRKGIFALLVATTALVGCSKDSDLKHNTVTINNEEKKITKAEYKEKGVFSLFLYFYLNNSNERVELQIDKSYHTNSKPIKLTQREEDHIGRYWGVEYYTKNNKKLIAAYGGSDFRLFSQGTLTISNNPRKGVVNIFLKNGKVKGTDGVVYDFTLNYSGKMTDK